VGKTTLARLTANAFDCSFIALSAVFAGVKEIRAAMEAAQIRFRPILMTSFATALGSIPLILGTGGGSAARISIGGTASAPTVDLATTAVTAGTYTSATLTVDAYGRLTSASTGSSGGAQLSDVFMLMGA
jgi:hypothetical protein